jgi:hypothetical protein
LGDVVFKTYSRGDARKIVVTRVPNFAGCVPTAAQRIRRDRLREATAYAQRVYADPAAKAFYVAAAQKLGRQAFRLAVSDFLRADARLTSPDIAALLPHHAAERASTGRARVGRAPAGPAANLRQGVIPQAARPAVAPCLFRRPRRRRRDAPTSMRQTPFTAYPQSG